MSYTRILVALDFSQLSQQVFDQALELAIDHRAALQIYHALMLSAPLTTPPFTGEFGLSPHLMGQTYQTEQTQIEHQLTQAKQDLEHYRALAERAGISATITVKLADPGVGICTTAESWNADLIVLGRRGRRGLTEVILGSVSNHVLHHAPCSVLVVQGEGSQTLSALARADANAESPR